MADALIRKLAGGARTDYRLGAFLGPPAAMVSRLGTLLCPALVREPALGWAQGIAAALPPAFEAFGFESHLGGPVADFALRLNLSTRALRSLDGAFAPGEPLQAAPSLPGWSALRATTRDLLRADSRIRDDLSGLWVTFERPHEAPEPALHACLDAAHVLHGASEPLDHGGAMRMQAALSRIRDLWQGPEADPAPLESLQRAAGFLIGRGRFAHVSFAPARGAEAWKASLMIRRDALPDFLREAGWSGDPALVARILEQFCPQGEFLRTGWTAGPGSERRLGFELFSGAAREGGKDRASVAGRLLELGLCSAPEIEALQAWEGIFPECDPLSGRLFLAARKWYVKVVVDTLGGISGKAYLSWIPAAAEAIC